MINLVKACTFFGDSAEELQTVVDTFRATHYILSRVYRWEHNKLLLTIFYVDLDDLSEYVKGIENAHNN